MCVHMYTYMYLFIGDVLFVLYRVYDLQFMDKLREVVAHDSEILCVEFSNPELGK